MAHAFDIDTEAQGLIDFVDASPSSFHACAEAAARLTEAGFTEVVESEPFPTAPGAHFLIRGGSLIAWDTRGAYAAGLGPAAGFRIVGAHTDSPNLRIKPNPTTSGRLAPLGVEVYGGPLLNSWLDRDLGLVRPGRGARRGARNRRARLFRDTTTRCCGSPQLAIHLDRERQRAG